MNINFHNKTGNTELYLFFVYSDTNTSGVKKFKNNTYYQPWKDGTLSLNDPYSCSFDWINSGTFWFIITNEEGDKTIAKNPNTAMGSADKNWVGGFFEMTSLETVKVPYFDITNVDQVGLLCGIKFSDGTTCGYGEDANKFISGIENSCSLGTNSAANISLVGKGDGVTYQKLWGPTEASISSLYNGSVSKYLDLITKNQTTIHIKSDSTKSSVHAGTKLLPINFTGTFGEPATLPADATLKKSDIIFWLEAKDSTSKGVSTFIYFTNKALNGSTIMSGSSSEGMYVYPAFEYANPKKPSTISKGGWANNVPLNWTAIGANAVADTTCFQALISSVGRDLITALNLGYIGISPTTNNFTYGEETSYATKATQETYINQWNRYITQNSDSYGMSYSDNAHAKVLFHPPLNGTIDCFVLKQNDPTTGSYRS